MLAFQNKQSVRDQVLDRSLAHARFNNLGIDEIGIPPWLVNAHELIYQHLCPEDGDFWLCELLHTIPLGIDLENGLAQIRFKKFLLTDDEVGLADQVDRAGSQIIRRAVMLIDRALAGKMLTIEQWIDVQYECFLLLEKYDERAKKSTAWQNARRALNAVGSTCCFHFPKSTDYILATAQAILPAGNPLAWSIIKDGLLQSLAD